MREVSCRVLLVLTSLLICQHAVAQSYKHVAMVTKKPQIVKQVGVSTEEEPSALHTISRLIQFKDKYIVQSKYSTIELLDKELSVLKTIARKGRGPGEFMNQDYTQIKLLNDTLYVMDMRLKKVMVFDPHKEFSLIREYLIPRSSSSISGQSAVRLSNGWLFATSKQPDDENVIVELDSKFEKKSSFLPLTYHQFASTPTQDEKEVIDMFMDISLSTLTKVGEEVYFSYLFADQYVYNINLRTNRITPIQIWHKDEVGVSAAKPNKGPKGRQPDAVGIIGDNVILMDTKVKLMGLFTLANQAVYLYSREHESGEFRMGYVKIQGEHNVAHVEYEGLQFISSFRHMQVMPQFIDEQGIWIIPFSDHDPVLLCIAW